MKRWFLRSQSTDGLGRLCPKHGVSSHYCTTKFENTHGTEFRELLYPWHPWFGLRVGVHAAIERFDGVAFRCSVSGSDAGRWLEVPAWMFDRSAYAQACAAADGHADLAAVCAEDFIGLE